MFIQLHDDAYHIIRQSSIERKLELHRVQILSPDPFLPAQAIMTSDYHPPSILYPDAALDSPLSHCRFSFWAKWLELWRGGWMDWSIDRTMGSRVTTIDEKASRVLRLWRRFLSDWFDLIDSTFDVFWLFWTLNARFLRLPMQHRSGFCVNKEAIMYEWICE